MKTLVVYLMSGRDTPELAAAAACFDEQPVAQLDRVAHRVEEAEVRAAEDLPTLRVLDHVRRQEAACAQLRQLYAQHQPQRVGVDRGEAGLAADVRIAEGGCDLVDVGIGRRAKQQLFGA